MVINIDVSKLVSNDYYHYGHKYSSTLLYPSLCWNELRLGTGWRPPLRGSVFFEQLPRSYLAIFFAKRACHIYYRGGKKIGV